MLQLRHKNLHVWKSSKELVEVIYALTQHYPSIEKFGLVNQLRRAAVSVPSNIAEGCSKSSLKERKRFLEIARSSLVELDTQIELSLSLGYLSQVEITELNDLANKIFAQLSVMIR